MTCARCLRDASVGRHGLGDCPFEARGASAHVESVTWPGGKIFENLGDQPVRCDSPADLKRELKARNLEPFVRHIDGSPHTRSWATMDPQTLANAEALVGRRTVTAPTPTLIQSMTVTVDVTDDAPVRVQVG